MFIVKYFGNTILQYYIVLINLNCNSRTSAVRSPLVANHHVRSACVMYVAARTCVDPDDSVGTEIAISILLQLRAFCPPYFAETAAILEATAFQALLLCCRR